MLVTQDNLDLMDTLGVGLYYDDEWYGLTQAVSPTNINDMCVFKSDGAIITSIEVEGGYGADFLSLENDGLSSEWFNASWYDFIVEIKVEPLEVVRNVSDVLQSDLDFYLESNVELWCDSEWYGAFKVETPQKIGDGLLWFKAQDGFIINSITMYDGIYGTIQLSIDSVGSASDTFTYNEFEYAIEIITRTETSTEALGANLVHRIDSEQVRVLMGARLRKVSYSAGGGSLSENVIDYGKYIINLLHLPFKLDSEFIGDLAFIQLADFTSDVETETITVDKLVIDLGIVEVPSVYDDFRDLKNVVCTLYAPQLENIDLDPQFVIGYQVSVKYEISLYDGVVTVLINSSKTGGVFRTVKSTIGDSVPLANVEGGNSNLLTNNKVNLGVNNDLTHFKIEVQRPNYKPDNQFETPILEAGVLSGVSGFIRVDEISIDTISGTSEVERLKSILRGGVIINE